MNCRHWILVCMGMGAIVGLAGCGGGLQSLPPVTPPPKPISVLFLVAPPSSMAIHESVTVIAAVLNDSANSQVTWSLSCGSTVSGACGTLSATAAMGETPTIYTAPSAIPAGGTVTLKATSVTDPTKSVSATITITPPIPISVAFGGVTPAVVQVNGMVSFNAKISNDISANPQVQWTASCNGGPCGSFNPGVTGSETQTAYTAPVAVPSGGAVTVTATSVTDPTKSATATITIIKAAATLANGTYVFQVAGPVGPLSNFISGVIVAENGAITGGEQDYINYAVNQTDEQYQPEFDPIAGGSYGTTPDGNLQITIKTNDLAVGASGVETLNGVIVSGSRVLITSFGGYIASGTMDLQASTATPGGGYAFTTFGVDEFGGTAGIGGVLNVDSTGGISGTGSVLDINAGSTFTGQVSLAASTVSAPDSFGRVVFHLFPSGAQAVISLYLAGYMVDGARIRLIETSGDNFMGVMGGTAVAQGTSTGKFSSSSISGSTYVFGAAGEDANGTLQIAGLVTANSDGSLRGTLNWNDLTGKSAQSPLSFSGSYAVDATGRATLSNLTDGSSFEYQLQLYLTGDGQGLLLSGENAVLVAGRAAQQQSGPFSGASFSGSYGLNAAQYGVTQFTGPGPAAALGPLTVVAGNSGNAFTGFVDFGEGITNVAVSGSLTSGANGIFTGTLTGLSTAFNGTPGNFTAYLVDPARAVMIETDSSQLTLGYLELQQ